jgi:pyridine nucleotide-disulfide oxidoreductase family protein
MKRLVLLGGGHAHVEVLRSLVLQPLAGAGVTLVSPADRQLYSGMVPGHIAGHYALEDCAIELDRLAERAGAAFHRSRAALVDPTRREITLADGGSLPYDVLSLDIGARAFTGEVEGVERHALIVRPLDRMLQAWSEVQARAAQGRVRSITMVGGGAAGVELALAMDHRLRASLGEGAPHVRVVTDAPAPLAELAGGARARVARILAGRGIGLHCGHRVREVGADFVRLEGGNQFASDATFWSAGAAAPDLVRDSGFSTDAHGYLLTDETLRSVSHPEVFGAGDCATQRGLERPKAGVFAVRAGPALAMNLRSALSGAPLARHVTGKRYLALLSAGDRHAVGAWNGFSFEGDWAWAWKDRIDRKFIARYR